jgi:hypothetical protein
MPFRQNDAGLWISKLPETTINTPYILNTDFEKVASRNPITLFPNYQIRDDAGQPGNTTEFPVAQWCIDFIEHPAISIAKDIDSEMMGRLALRAAGGAVVDTLLAGAAYKHVAPLLSGTLGQIQPPPMTVISVLGEADWRFTGVCVNRIRMFQQHNDAPQIECDLLGTGGFVTPNGVASLPTVAASIPCIDGNSTILQWTDAGGLRDFVTGDGFKAWSIELNNNLQTNDRQAGDPTVTLTYETVTVTPSYTRRLLAGEARSITASITVPLNATRTIWEKMSIGQVITDVTFAARGPIITSPHRQMIQFTLPKVRIASIGTDSDNGIATKVINLRPFYDSVTATALIVQVNNSTAANFK